MQRLDGKTGGWRSVKAKIAEIVRRVNAIGNIRIVRSGSTDTVTFSDNGIVINVQQFPGQGPDIRVIRNPGLLIYRADGTQEFFSRADIYDGYDPENDDDWSLSFAVDSFRLVAFSTTPPDGTAAMPSGKERYDGDASADPVELQTYYRIPVIRTITIDGNPVKLTFDVTGIYQEDIFCDSSRGPVVHLIKIG